LVTHHVHLLSRCDSVIVLENGRIKHYSPYHVLVEQGVDFAGAVDVSKITLSQEVVEDETTEPSESMSTKKANEVSSNKRKETIIATSSEPIKHDDEVAGKLTEGTKDKQKQAGKKLLSAEEREEGSVSASAYVHYARSGGVWLVAWMFIIQAFGRGCEIMSGE
jgi:ABC-type sulfate/molybdate transport systems ATPase subunit